MREESDLKPIGAIGDASLEDVLAGRVFSSEEEGTNVEGEMPNHGHEMVTPSTSDVCFSAGCYDGITVNQPSYSVTVEDEAGETLETGSVSGNETFTVAATHH